MEQDENTKQDPEEQKKRGLNFETMPYDGKGDSEEEEPDEESEYYRQENYVPHYIKYKEELINEVLADFESLSGVPVLQTGIVDSNKLNDSSLPSFYSPEYGLSLELIPPFIQAIVKAGRKQDMLDYLDSAVAETTLNLEQHDLSKGKVTPKAYDDPDREDSFWSYRHILISREDQERIIAIQRLEIERFYRKWLVKLRKGLSVTQENPQSTKVTATPDSNPPYDITNLNEVKRNSLLSYSYKKKQVKKYFMQLVKKGFYSKNEVENFLKANLVGFAKQGEVIQKVKLPIKNDLRQKDLTYFIYKFWYGIPTEKRNQGPWIDLLKDNFDYYNNTEYESIYKAFARQVVDNYPFSDID